MFSEVLKVIPKVDGAALNSMERTLGSRFAKLAKKFGSGLKAAILGGGVAALAVSVIDKLLNPLKETQESIEKILGRADDLQAFATQFGTSSGNLFKLEQLARAKGLSSEELRVLLLKFQGAVVEAKADTSKPSPVSQFLTNPDMADNFFQFIQSLQKLTKDQQTFVQTQVFGEKQILKMSEFLNEKDFASLAARIGLVKERDYSPTIDRAASIADLDEELKTKREGSAFIEQASKISAGMIANNNKAEIATLAQETKRLDSYNDLKNLSNTTAQIQKSLENAMLLLVKETPRLINAIVELSKSRLVRGALGASGKGE